MILDCEDTYWSWCRSVVRRGRQCSAFSFWGRWRSSGHQCKHWHPTIASHSEIQAHQHTSWSMRLSEMCSQKEGSLVRRPLGRLSTSAATFRTEFQGCRKGHTRRHSRHLHAGCGTRLAPWLANRFCGCSLARACPECGSIQPRLPLRKHSWTFCLGSVLLAQSLIQNVPPIQDNGFHQFYYHLRVVKALAESMPHLF